MWRAPRPWARDLLFGAVEAAARACGQPLTRPRQRHTITKKQANKRISSHVYVSCSGAIPTAKLDCRSSGGGKNLMESFGGELGRESEGGQSRSRGMWGHVHGWEPTTGKMGKSKKSRTVNTDWDDSNSRIFYCLINASKPHKISLGTTAKKAIFHTFSHSPHTQTHNFVSKKKREEEEKKHNSHGLIRSCCVDHPKGKSPLFL